MLDPRAAGCTYSRRNRRGVTASQRGGLATLREERLLEVVEIGGVVHVAHRVDVLRPDRVRVSRTTASGAGRERHAARLEGVRAARRSGRGTRRGRGRACPAPCRGITQSVWPQSASVPSARRPSVRRRAQTRRKPMTSVRSVIVSPSGSGARIASSAARTTQARLRSAYQSRVKPSALRVDPGEVLGVAQQRRRAHEAVRAALVEADPVRDGDAPAPGRPPRPGSPLTPASARPAGPGPRGRSA